MEKKTIIKIHLDRDFSSIEFEVMADPSTGEGIPTSEELARIWERLPQKNTQPIGTNGLRQTPESAKRNADKSVKREPPATANQKRVLEKYGEWEEGMTKSQASRILSELGI